MVEIIEILLSPLVGGVSLVKSCLVKSYSNFTQFLYQYVELILYIAILLGCR